MNLSAQQPEFAVLGGGLCGRLVAWRLAGAGRRVALYERGDDALRQAVCTHETSRLGPHTGSFVDDTRGSRGFARSAFYGLMASTKQGCFGADNLSR